MNDEIKETLEYKIDFLTKSLDIGIPTKNRRYFNDIKDYITNLQQELEEEKRIEEADLHKIQSLEEENERLKDIINKLENYIQKGINKSKMFPTAEMAYQLILDKLKELEKGNE